MSQPPIFLLLGGIAALALVAAVLGGFVRAYRGPTGPERVVAFLLILLVLESSLYANPNDVSGIFHPEFGGGSFRVFDLLIPLALVARVITAPRGRRFPAQAVVWWAFMAWLAFAAVAGVLEGNSFGLVAFHAKALIYIGATFVLVSAVPPRRWLESRALHRAIGVASAMALFLMLTSTANIAIVFDNPLLPLMGFGAELGSDAATLFAVLGIGTLCVGMCSERGRLKPLLVSLPLIAAPLASGQRAAIVGLLVAIGVGALLVPFAMRNIRITGAEIGLAVLAVVGVMMALLFVGAIVTSSSPRLPLANQIQETFNSRGKQLSEQDRINQWAQARQLIAARPWFGWGLGKQYDFYSPGFFEFMRTDITHNIATDLLLRMGVVGLLLFVLAVASTLRDAALAWVRELDARVAALALACCCAFAGLIVKGLVESLFEKYRLAIVMGGLVGVSISLVLARLATADDPLPAHGLRAGVEGGAVAR